MEIIANLDRWIYKKENTSQLPYSLPLYFKQFIAFYAFFKNGSHILFYAR